MKKNHLEKLNPSAIELNARHLIEASAGTGKTYNITRLYLRLLLEKGLTVQQILVMTFTKAATEELRGRIEEQIRAALLGWDALVMEDPFFSAINNNFSEQQLLQRETRLNIALRELDEASIYTIHGFCSRALSSQAFASGISMDISMETDTSELLMESVRNWLRKINQHESEFSLLEQKNCHTPDAFFKKYYDALTTSSDLQTPEQDEMQIYYDESIDKFMGELFYAQKIKNRKLLEENKNYIFEVLVDGKKDEQARCDEWEQIMLWLDSHNAEEIPEQLGKFINGNRYRANEELKQLFNPLKELKTSFTKKLTARKKDLQKQIENVPVYKLITQGIQEIRNTFCLLKKQQMVMDFNDLITYLSEKLQSNSGTALIEALREQYPVALVDEFQDTDPSQYAIFDILYPQSSSQYALFMIGDPKQAIYAFRGGDIFTYLKARDDADYHWYMDTNWRSVKDVVSAYNHLFSGEIIDNSVDVFGYGIGYEKINSTHEAKAEKTPLSDCNKQLAAINYCWLSEVDHPSGAKNNATTEDFKTALAQWCASEISRLLTVARLGKEPLQEQDIAILVRTGAEAQIIRESLSKAGFPSVYLSEKENIFKSAQAKELLLVLKGILELENDSLLLAALSTYLMAGNARKLALYNAPDSEQEWEEQREKAIKLREIWLKKGCISMIMELIGHDYQPEPSQHERSLTNMIHLAELLQQASRQYKHPQQLLKWFIEQCQMETHQEEAQLRLESDANLIRVVTQHGSKGLEYPIVFIPFASLYKDPVRFGKQLNEYFEYHDIETCKAQCQIGQTTKAITLATEEGHAESIRLLYVAITRAAHRCYLGIAPFDNCQLSPLGLTLKLSAAEMWQETLQTLVDSSNGSSSLIKINDSDYRRYIRKDNKVNNESLTVASINHPVDCKWSLNSFSSLIRDRYSIRQDQKEHIDDEAEDNANKNHSQLLRFSLRKGADSGNLLHDILEHTNFNSTQDWSLQAPVLRFGGLSETDQSELKLWLQDCLDTPLPAIEPETESFTLSDLGWSQTLRETEFYFPIKDMKLELLSACLEEHRGDGQTINLPEKQQLYGMMRGFIDLIFEHRGRFYVADYKSTHLGEQFHNYHWQALKENNQHHYYDLQYLIYSLALHRYLASRIADYDPASHFGGVYYLYLRGMSSRNDEFYGIFHTAIDAALLAKLDKVFQGKVVRENAA